MRSEWDIFFVIVFFCNFFLSGVLVMIIFFFLIIFVFGFECDLYVIENDVFYKGLKVFI